VVAEETAAAQEVEGAEAADAGDVVAASDLEQLPPLGVGLGFRPIHSMDVYRYRKQIDFLEITADHYFDPTPTKQQELLTLSRNFRLIPHGLAMSFGSAEGLDADYLRKYAGVVERCAPMWCSDHIAFTRAGGLDIGHLVPIPKTRASLKVLAENIGRFQEHCKTPLILENITETIRFENEEMNHAEFLNELLARTSIGLLLDVTNLFINSIQHRFDPVECLRELPPDRIVQLHFSGGHLENGEWIDSHSQTTSNEVWDLLEEVLKYAPVKGVILERDESIPPLVELLPELERARQLGIKHGRWK
jgi:uncharacterized protein